MCVIPSFASAAQSSENYQVEHGSVSGGVSVDAQSSSFHSNNTTGENLSGRGSSAAYVVSAGFVASTSLVTETESQTNTNPTPNAGSGSVSGISYGLLGRVVEYVASAVNSAADVLDNVVADVRAWQATVVTASTPEVSQNVLKKDNSPSNIFTQVAAPASNGINTSHVAMDNGARQNLSVYEKSKDIFSRHILQSVQYAQNITTNSFSATLKYASLLYTNTQTKLKGTLDASISFVHRKAIYLDKKLSTVRIKVLDYTHKVTSWVSSLWRESRNVHQ